MKKILISNVKLILYITLKNKYKLFILFLFYYLKKNFKYIWFKFLINTSYGKKKLHDKQEESKLIIKRFIANKKFKITFSKLPDKSTKTQLRNIIHNRKSEINNKVSGGVYICNDELIKLLQDVNNDYMFSNPLHLDLYPELGKMESEIISMVGHLYDMPKSGGGNLTTGGTESTILALKAYKKLYKNKYFHLGQPDVLCTKTVHAAVNKACELLDLNINYVKLNNDFTMDLNDLVKKISYKSCVIIASAPCFPYGLTDNIKEISIIAETYNIPLHVDACLGGFIMQFTNDKLTFNDNIQSISVDPHKFGCAPKGSSVLLWKNKELKHNQYFIVEDWTGGIYASSSLPGSRVGSQIVTTWAALLYHGYQMYYDNAQKIVNKTQEFKRKLQELESYVVIGNPNINVVAFYSKKYPISQIVKFLKINNWNINVLQNPLCLHICITNKNIHNINGLYYLLEQLLTHDIDKKKTNDITAIYGMASEIPDKAIIKDLVSFYLDTTTEI